MTRRPPARDPRRPRRPAKRRSVRARAAVLALGAVAALFVFIYPTHALLAQRRDAADVQDRVKLLRAENEKLESEQSRLENNAEIERRARQEFNLVRPGEKAYAIVPGTTPPDTAADEVP